MHVEDQRLKKANLPATSDSWKPYVSSSAVPWNLRRVVHLHRRAGFAATWSELQRDLAAGPAPAITRILAGKACTEGNPPDFNDLAQLLLDSAGDAERLKAWWFYRMLFGPDALGERLTLCWHNHFATSNRKVNDTGAMRRQNAIFRELARAPFGKLVDRVVHDPALLRFLDAPENKKGHANENLARELMELFTLGIGHYSERDVKDAARVLTGWTFKDNVFHLDAAQHDDGVKTVLGHSGRLRGDDLLSLLLAHPATAERLAFRLCELLMGEGVVSPAEIKALAAGLRAHNLDIGWGVETVLRSQIFFADANLGTRVLSPAEFLVASARMLEMFDRPPSTLVLADLSARMGQDLFYPPNVGGWKGGRSWISTQTIIARANYIVGLVQGVHTRDKEPLDVLALLHRHCRGRHVDDVISFGGELLHGIPPNAQWHDRLRKALAGNGVLTADTARRVIALVLASPEAQLA
jgi:uncharacterized protein (DUF1800 family)